ncbi:hypothetical protein KCMC57_up18640 [Kitasatospora sp. CMC57]|uniref:Endonuclease/exonuclease/phosphatase domain-containing protein n=1 Tax=Kitasatospora sp. CMC57 TaxID=3231513 RepID=A0AB33JVL9_9ACTN
MLTVKARDTAGNTDSLTLLVPVQAAGAPLRLKVATWNLANAGAAFTGPVEKQLRVVLTQGLDVVALQETAGTAAQTLATALGWYTQQTAGSMGILSRYPLTAATTPALPAVGVTVQLPGGRSVRCWGTHLDETG